MAEKSPDALRYLDSKTPPQAGNCGQMEVSVILNPIPCICFTPVEIMEICFKPILPHTRNSHRLGPKAKATLTVISPGYDLNMSIYWLDDQSNSLTAPQ